MEEIKWGIIGVGDVTEVKSGPAFQKVNHSQLVGVMRRNAEKARDYAERHGVNFWCTDAMELIRHPEINALYIATPPDSHLHYAQIALAAGKAVYLEKPMTLNATEARMLTETVQHYQGKLSVAHYRRAQPYFKKIKSLLMDGRIGEPRTVQLKYQQTSLPEEVLQDPKMQWRLDPVQSGGGLFHDLAPHQVDILLHFFGEMEYYTGIAINQAAVYSAADAVAGLISFKNKVLFNGSWAFNVAEQEDTCEIVGSEGRLIFSFFSFQPIELYNREGKEVFAFERLEHVQQPMIEQVVQYFKGQVANPCPVEEGLKVMQVLDAFTAR